MRPRFANRGSQNGASRQASSKPRFNEAPIRESGKLIIDELHEHTTGGFNEAPIRESGKWC